MAIAQRVDLLGRAAARVEVGGQFLNGHRSSAVAVSGGALGKAASLRTARR